MFPGGHGPAARSRFLEGAHLRKTLVYLLAAVLAVSVALAAVILATPPDLYESVHVDRLQGVGSQVGHATTQVTVDAETGRTTISVQSPDGTVRRYQVNKSDGGWQIEPAPEAQR